MERAMGIEPTPEHWETCAPNSNEKFETTWEQNPRLVGHFEGSDSHKGNRIIKQLAEACGSRTHHSTRKGPNRRLWRPGRSPDPFRLRS